MELRYGPDSYGRQQWGILGNGLISSFRRADELADAMDARCYSGSKNRTKYKKMRLTFRDLIGFIVTTGLIVGVVFINIYL